jgi:two-component system, sensor histidine kinase and response regulator
MVTESLLRAVFESTFDGLLVVDLEGKVLKFNRRFAELWKIPDDILATHNDEKLLSFILGQLSEPELFMNKVRELYEDPNALSNDYIRFRDGRIFERFSRPLISGDKSTGRVWIYRDITEHRKSQEVFAAITDLSPDIISIIDAQGRLVFNSQASERIHGYQRNELLGKNTMDLIHPEDQENVAQVMQELFTTPGSIASAQYRYLNKDGSYAWMEATAVNQIENNLINGLVSISREISKHKKLENDLSHALRLRDEFVSIASHELKSPVASMKLQLQMLLRNGGINPPSEPSKKFHDLNGLLDQVNSLQRLIEDLLSVSKIRMGKMDVDLQPENLSEVTKTLVERFQKLFDEVYCTLSVDVQPDLWVKMDRLRIEQVLINLMSNAIKYAPGSLIRIQLENLGSLVRFRIQDEGPGIPQEKHDAIFNLFERANGFNHISGLGIGLFVCKSIVEQHHGKIFLELPAIGSSFVLDLPKLDP